MEESEGDTAPGTDEGVTFRLCHISDLHFSTVMDRLNGLEVADTARARSGWVMSQLLKGNPYKPSYPSTFRVDVALKLLRALADEQKRGHADGLIVTGDLATTGLDADLLTAKNYFSGDVPPQWLPVGKCPSLLDGDGVVITLPGNHDRYEGVALMPGGRRFEQHFGRSWDFDRGNACDPYAVTGPSRVRTCVLEKKDQKTRLGIVLADFSLDSAHAARGPLGWVGQGAASCIEELCSATQVLRSQAQEEGLDMAVLWAVHFPPFFPGLDSNLQLIGERGFAAAAQQAGIPLILAGHTHQALRYELGGANPVSVLCCGSSAGRGRDEVHSYTRIALDVGQGGKLLALRAEQMKWDIEALAFVGTGAYPAHP